jgi:GTP-binding protein LepA
MTDLSHIRNFSIVAHIDHGKSTLADRLIQMTGTVADRDMKEQMLDAMDIERERGITIKANTVRSNTRRRTARPTSSTSSTRPATSTSPTRSRRSMRAVEGSLLVVDATQGVEAQTLANVYQAIDADHEIVPVLNKIDLPAAERPGRRADRGRDRDRRSDAIQISAKTGLGIHEVLEAIVTACPRRRASDRRPAEGHAGRQLVRPYLGVVVLVRVIDGVLRKGDRIKMMSTNAVYRSTGRRVPPAWPIDELGPGEIGFSPPRSSRSATPASATRSPMNEGHRQAAAGLQAGVAGGVLRPLPGRQQRVRGPARRDREARAQRRELQPRDGDLRRARLRLPLRLPRPAAPRGHPRPARAGIRYRPHHHRAQSVVYQIYMKDGTMLELHNPADMPDPCRSTGSRSRGSRRRSSCPTTISATC